MSEPWRLASSGCTPFVGAHRQRLSLADGLGGPLRVRAVSLRCMTVALCPPAALFLLPGEAAPFDGAPVDRRRAPASAASRSRVQSPVETCAPTTCPGPASDHDVRQRLSRPRAGAATRSGPHGRINFRRLTVYHQPVTYGASPDSKHPAFPQVCRPTLDGRGSSRAWRAARLACLAMSAHPRRTTPTAGCR